MIKGLTKYQTQQQTNSFQPRPTTQVKETAKKVTSSLSFQKMTTTKVEANKNLSNIHTVP